jgi:hypothetical protein
MHDPSSLRSRAESSLRLAELAKTPRARQLFHELADEYERRARGELTAEAEAAPSLVPLPVVSESPASVDVRIVVDAPPIADASPVPIATEAPLVPNVMVAESDDFIAGLMALREETSGER